MEGAACVFEFVTTGRLPSYCTPEDGEDPASMFADLERLPKAEGKERIVDFKFLNQQTGQKYILYKAGFWFVNEGLKNHPEFNMQILATMDADQILSLR